MGEIVNVTNVDKVFKQGEEQVNVLEDVSLKVSLGEMLSVTGKSGSGKTTLLDIIGGIRHPDSGEVHVDGSNLVQYSESERTEFRRRHIGMVFQFFNLIPTLTAIENIQFPLRLDHVSEDGRVEYLMDELNITDRADAYPSTLSGGEKQRVAIARALVHSPSVVLADEPTGNLDHDHAQKVLETFRTLCKEQDVALIMGTHSDECASFSDRVLKLRDGTLAEK